MTWIEARHRDACSVCAGRKAHEFGYPGNWRDMRFLTLGEVEDNLWHYADDGARVAHTYAEYIALRTIRELLTRQTSGWISVKDRLPEIGIGDRVIVGAEGFSGVAVFDGGDFDPGRDWFPGITHWRLFPSPPNPEVERIKDAILAAAAADRLAAEMEAGLKDKHQYAEC